jgi:methionyl-tRNA synthetase
VEVPYFLSRYDPDPLRFYLTAPAPETRDTVTCPEGLDGFSWEDFVEWNNEYLGDEGQLFGMQHVVEYQEETSSHWALTYDHTGAIGTWAKSELPAGQTLRPPAPLFKKLDESVIEEEHARLEG